MADENEWDRRYRLTSNERPLPCTALAEHADLLPPPGKALDVACGRAGNAFFLATSGFEVTALDLSEVVIESVNVYANEHQLKVHGVHADIRSYQLPVEHYDVITVSNFLERSICQSLIDALSPGGVLVYQTFVQEKVDPDSGPRNPAFLLEPNELHRIFGTLRVLVSFDAGFHGKRSDRYRNQAMLIAAKIN